MSQMCATCIPVRAPSKYSTLEMTTAGGSVAAIIVASAFHDLTTLVLLLRERTCEHSIRFEHLSFGTLGRLGTRRLAKIVPEANRNSSRVRLGKTSQNE